MISVSLKNLLAESSVTTTVLIKSLHVVRRASAYAARSSSSFCSTELLMFSSHGEMQLILESFVISHLYKIGIYTNICIFEYKIAGFYHNINTETSFLPLLRQFLPSINRGNHCLIFFFFLSWVSFACWLFFGLPTEEPNIFLFILKMKDTWVCPTLAIRWTKI